jgi:hypothetical protein
MFKKKPQAQVSEAQPVQPIKVEELASNVQAVKEEVLDADSEDDDSDQFPQNVIPAEEVTEEQVLATLNKHTADIEAIKYHLRLI